MFTHTLLKIHIQSTVYKPRFFLALFAVCLAFVVTVVEDVAVVEDVVAVTEDEIEVEGINSLSSSAWLSIDFLESNCIMMNPG